MQRRLFSMRAMIWRRQGGRQRLLQRLAVGTGLARDLFPHGVDLFPRQHPALEGIDEDAGAVLGHGPDQEVTGERHPVQPQPGPLGHGDQHQAQRDRDARAPFQHQVQEAVARVVVVRDVAPEPHLPIEQVQHGGQHHATPVRARAASRSAAAAVAPGCPAGPAWPRSDRCRGRGIRLRRSAAQPALGPAPCSACEGGERRARGLRTRT